MTIVSYLITGQADAIFASNICLSGYLGALLENVPMPVSPAPEHQKTSLQKSTGGSKVSTDQRLPSRCIHRANKREGHSKRLINEAKIPVQLTKNNHYKHPQAKHACTKVAPAKPNDGLHGRQTQQPRAQHNKETENTKNNHQSTIVISQFPAGLASYQLDLLLKPFLSHCTGNKQEAEYQPQVEWQSEGCGGYSSQSSIDGICATSSAGATAHIRYANRSTAKRAVQVKKRNKLLSVQLLVPDQEGAEESGAENTRPKRQIAAARRMILANVGASCDAGGGGCTRDKFSIDGRQKKARCVDCTRQLAFVSEKKLGVCGKCQQTLA